MKNIMSSTPTVDDTVITVSLPLSQWKVISASIDIATAAAQYDADADEALGCNRAYHTRRTSDLLNLVYDRLTTALIDTAFSENLTLQELPLVRSEDITDDEFTAINDRYEQRMYDSSVYRSVNVDAVVPF